MRWIFRAYALVFVVSGAASALFAHLELPLWFGIAPGSSLLNQYRFLRAIEAGFGALLLYLEPEFFAGGRVRRVVLAVFAAIPLSRAIGFSLDGAPGPEFLALLIAETALFLLFAGTVPAAPPAGPGT